MTKFVGTTSKYAVWTSDYEGDLFVANSAEIDETYISFYMNSTLVKKYLATDFIRYNPKLFEVIKE